MIERVWKVMKENVLANFYHETMDDLLDSIYQFIKSIDKKSLVVSNVQTFQFFKEDLYSRK